MKTCGQKVEFSFSSMELQLLARHSCGMSQAGDEIYSTVKRQTEELLGVKMVPDSYSSPRRLAGNGGEEKSAIRETRKWQPLKEKKLDLIHLPKLKEGLFLHSMNPQTRIHLLKEAGFIIA